MPHLEGQLVRLRPIEPGDIEFFATLEQDFDSRRMEADDITAVHVHDAHRRAAAQAENLLAACGASDAQFETSANFTQRSRVDTVALRRRSRSSSACDPIFDPMENTVR